MAQAAAARTPAIGARPDRAVVALEASPPGSPPATDRALQASDRACSSPPPRPVRLLR